MESDLLRRDVVLYIQMELCHNRTLGHWIADHHAKVLRKKKVRMCVYINYIGVCVCVCVCLCVHACECVCEGERERERERERESIYRSRGRTARRGRRRTHCKSYASS
jgi:hypothetical protein